MCLTGVGSTVPERWIPILGLQSAAVQVGCNLSLIETLDTMETVCRAEEVPLERAGR